MKNYEEVQKIVVKSIRQIYGEAQSRLWRYAYWERVFVRFVVFFSLAGLLGWLFVMMWNLQPNAVFRLLSIDPFGDNVGNIAFTTVYLFVWVILFILPLGLVYRLPERYKNIAYPIYIATVLPIATLSAVQYAYYLLNLSSYPFLSPQLLISLALAFDVVLLVLTVFYIYVGTSLPYWMIMLFSKFINEDVKVFLPTYEGLSNEVIHRVYDKMPYWDKASTKGMLSYAHQKSSSVSIQAQTFSLIVGSLGLLGLVALIFTQEDLRSLLNVIENRLGSEYAGLSIYTMIITLVCIVFFACRYFIRSMILIRITDIIILLLERRLESIENLGLYVESSDIDKLLRK